MMYEAYFTKRLLEALTMAEEADDARERSVHLRTSRYYRDLLLHSERRHSPRHTVTIEAVIHHAAPNPRRVVVSDLSSCGFRMTFDEPLNPGRLVVLDIEALAPVEARVVWHHGGQAGCKFLHELHPSLVDAALAVSPRPE